MNSYDPHQRSFEFRVPLPPSSFDSPMAAKCHIWVGKILVFDSENASFPPCALTVLSFGPAIVISLICIFNLAQRLVDQYRPSWTKPFVPEHSLKYSEEQSEIKPRSLKWMITLFLLAFLGLSAQITMLIDSFSLSGLILSASWMVLVLLIIRTRPRSCPPTWLIFYVFEIVVEISFITSGMAKGKLSIFSHTVVAVVSFASIVAIIAMPFIPFTFSSDEISRVGSIPSHKHRSPEDNLTLWQFLAVSWLSPMLSIGTKRTINEEDVWTLAYQFQHTKLHEQFRKLKGSVLSRILRANIIDVIIISLIGILRLMSDYTLPLLLQQLLKAMEVPDVSVRVVLTYALLSFMARVFSAQMRVLALWYSRRCYERSRGEMIMMIYEKALVRKNVVGLKKESQNPGEQNMSTDGNTNSSSDESHKQTSRWRKHYDKFLSMFHRRQTTSPKLKDYASTGTILHLIRGDVYEVSQRLSGIDELINIPLGIIFACALIWKLLGPSSFLGIIVILVVQGLNLYFTKILLRWKRQQKTAGDARIQATVQFIEVIRHLRWYGWQKYWLDQVLKARLHELKIRAKTMTLSVGISTIDALGRYLFPVVALYSYTYLAGNPLSIDVIFPALQCIQKLDQNLSGVPRLITGSLNAYIALGRIEEFMTEPNKQDECYTAMPNNSIKLKDCDFAWPEKPDLVLKNINLEIQEGLTVIYGKVGAGKSALLQALLGELDQKRGEKQISNNKMGYCSQTPWLQSMSIRDNILFFEPYMESWYRKVVDACELLPDFEAFSHGDLSNIGENGIGLSGGQKARVALARAVYSRASILLLDDPLSALDHQTAESIVHKLFQGPLVQDRSVVLVTHRIDLIRHLADQVIEVIDGEAEVLSVEDLDSKFREVNGNYFTKVEIDENSQKKVSGTPEKFLEDEHRAKWGVQMKVNWTYIKAGGLHWWVAMILFSAGFHLTTLGVSWFLKVWGEAYGEVRLLANQSLTRLWNSEIVKSSLVSPRFGGSSLFDGYPSPLENVQPWLWTYFGISIAQTIQLGFLVTEIIIGLRASKFLFQAAMDKVSGATFRYYDVTPVGQLMNRLTSDISNVDGKITFHSRRLVSLVVGWVISLGVIFSVTPSFLALCLSIMGIYTWIFLQYFQTSQSLRRLQAVSLSPLLSDVGELLLGLTTVRAFHADANFQSRIISVLDKFQGMDHFYSSVLSWFLYRIETLTAILAFALTAVAVIKGLTAGMTAFMLTTVYHFVNTTHFLSRVYAELQLEFISVERVDELLHIKQENPGTIQPPAAWPRFGADITLDNVTIRYASHLDPVLRNITLRIPGGSTVALVGRTGSGKSTLAQALIGIVRPSIGKIVIDEISVDDVDIETLRQRVTFVAQDPVLFSGTIRHNLDPVEQFSDEECAAVLDRICNGQNWTLTTNIEPGGRNLSQGQRQLIGVTRAVLRRSSIVILDEATASIDYETSLSIQKILHDEMTESTVITIAHRIEAVKDADYAIVLENGMVLRHGPAMDMLL